MRRQKVLKHPALQLLSNSGGKGNGFTNAETLEPCAAEAIYEAGVSSYQRLVEVEENKARLSRRTQHPQQLVDEIQRISRLLRKVGHNRT